MPVNSPTPNGPARRASMASLTLASLALLGGCSHLQALSHARLRAGDKKSVILEITPARDCHLELWEVRTHERAFEKVFGRRLAIKVIETSAATRTA